jgi:hypothetical protein
MRYTIAILAILIAGGSVLAQTPSTMSVVNEDQGRACMVLGDTTFLLSTTEKNGFKPPQQYSIFLGHGWSAERVRPRESTLADLLSNTDLIRPEVLNSLGWIGAYSAKGQTEQLIDDTGLISDLRIQSLLTQIFKGNPAVPQPADSIYFIYLAPELVPRLGTLAAGKHFLAYYNAVNTNGSRLRYVVVPYDPNTKTMSRNALDALISVVLQPQCV